MMSAAEKAAFAKAGGNPDALYIYAVRNRLMGYIYRVPLRDLERLVSIIEVLSDADLRRVAAYAEGLAEWGQMASESSDAAKDEAGGPATGAGTRT